MFDKAKVQAQLEEAQGKATARTLTIDDVAKLVDLAEAEAAKMPKWILKHIYFEHYKTVPHGYKYAAQATRIQFTFTQRGGIKYTTIARIDSRSQAYGGIVRRFVLNVDAMARGEYQVPYAGHSLLYSRLIAPHGFNHQGTKPV